MPRFCRVCLFCMGLLAPQGMQSRSAVGLLHHAVSHHVYGFVQCAAVRLSFITFDLSLTCARWAPCRISAQAGLFLRCSKRLPGWRQDQSVWLGDIQALCSPSIYGAQRVCVALVRLVLQAPLGMSMSTHGFMVGLFGCPGPLLLLVMCLCSVGVGCSGCLRPLLLGSLTLRLPLAAFCCLRDVPCLSAA